MDIELAQRACLEASKARQQLMGLYADGEFTRIQFLVRRGEIILTYDDRPDTRGTLVANLTTLRNTR